MRKRILTPLVIFTVASAVFALLVAYPVFRGIRADYEKAIAQKQEFAQLQEDQKRLREFDFTLVQYEQEFEKLEALFLDTTSPIEFFRLLDNAATEFQIRLKKTPGIPQQQKEDSWPSMIVQLEGDGTYPDVAAFLEKVEYAPYILGLEKLSITKGFENNVHFIASVKVYTKD